MKKRTKKSGSAINYDKTYIFFAGGKLSIKQAFEGVHAFGATGSGKTSSLKYLAVNMLNKGIGGIVLCDKADEADIWRKYIKETQRENDVYFLSEEKFNFLDYESKRKGGGETENIVQIFLEITGSSKTASQDPYWEQATSQLLRNAVDLLQMAGEKVSLRNINRVIKTAPKHNNDIKNEWFRSLFLKAAELDHHDYDLVHDYFLEDFIQLAEKTRSIVISTFTGIDLRITQRDDQIVLNC